MRYLSLKTQRDLVTGEIDWVNRRIQEIHPSVLPRQAYADRHSLMSKLQTLEYNIGLQRDGVNMHRLAYDGKPLANPYRDDDFHDTHGNNAYNGSCGCKARSSVGFSGQLTSLTRSVLAT